MSIIIKGQQGKSLFIEGNIVKIIQKGLFSVKSDKSVDISSISGVEVKKNGLTSGFIKLHLNSTDFELVPTSAFIAATDENAVLFTDSKNYKLACELKKEIESHKKFERKPKKIFQDEELEPEFILESHTNKTLKVRGGAIVIVKKQGILSQQREKTLPISNITSVEVKKPGTLSGYIQFSIAGGQALNSSYTLTGGAWDAASDENSVLFSGAENYQIALNIKHYVESYSPPAGDQQRVPNSSNSAADEIRKYKELLDDGIISEQEFESKKKQLLGF